MGAKRADVWLVGPKNLYIESQVLKGSLEPGSTSTSFKGQPKPEKGQERAEPELCLGSLFLLPWAGSVFLISKTVQHHEDWWSRVA